jgi:hypothetical protein
MRLRRDKKENSLVREVDLTNRRRARAEVAGYVVTHAERDTTRWRREHDSTTRVVRSLGIAEKRSWCRSAAAEAWLEATIRGGNRDAASRRREGDGAGGAASATIRERQHGRSGSRRAGQGGAGGTRACGGRIGSASAELGLGISKLGLYLIGPV